MNFEQKIVDVLKKAAKSKPEETAKSIIDALRLREEWSWRLANGDSGLMLDSRSQVDQEIKDFVPAPVVINRLVTDWHLND